MSIIKFYCFINSLLKQLKQSQLCCKICKTPSVPVGYATAACSKMNCVMDIIHAHGCTWRYDLNVEKSGVLVFGEREYKVNCSEIVFHLGNDR